MPSNIRVYELARELGMTNAETLDLAESLGIGVKSHSSSIVDSQADRVRRKAEREGLTRDEQPEEPKPAKKAAKKAKKAAADPGTVDWAAVNADGKVKKQSVAMLKAYCKAHSVKFTSKDKKADLVELVEDHLNG